MILFLESVGPQANDRNDPETHDHKRHRHHEQDTDGVSHSCSVGVQAVLASRTRHGNIRLQERNLRQKAKRDGERSSWEKFRHVQILI